MKENKILLFIPMYNCEKQITRVLDQIDPNVEKYLSEVLIVNNRSTDNGESVVADYLSNSKVGVKVNLLRNKDNYGLGGSHKVAFSYALENGFDYVIVLHGDDQGNINDIIPLLKYDMHEQYDCLLGARFQKNSKIQGYSWFRTFGNVVYNGLFSIVGRRKIYDLGSGLNCYKTTILSDKYYHKFPDDLTFNYCMILASIYRKQNFKFFPISWREDDQVSNVKLFSQAVRVLKLLFAFARNRERFLADEHRSKNVKSYVGDIIVGNERREYHEFKGGKLESV